jgi:hypothetical protein
VPLQGVNDSLTAFQPKAGKKFFPCFWHGKVILEKNKGLLLPNGLANCKAIELRGGPGNPFPGGDS